MSCGCCSPLRPRYKRLVDNIFPAYAEEGLVSSNMQKLIYYAATSPEKWDRIGDYLASKVWRDLNRTYPRFGFVAIGMEAMDQLLMACSSQHLNLYVESYLKTVQKLLESPEPEMQIRASESFLQFAQKEEDVPAYHRRYDFFISKFSQMCHYETNDPVVTNKIRVSGLQGIGGVVRKIESEDLAENIWSSTHMDKIIPSLLYNIQIGDYKAGQGRSQTPDLGNLSEDNKSPLQIAEDTFRKLMGRAGFLAIKAVMKPILQHLDIHKMWSPPDFAEHTFQMVMFSIQQQVNYIIIEMLMAHLDKRSEDTKVRVGIATVLSRIFSSRAIDASVGPSVLETINALLTHLRASVEQASASREPDPDAQRYHEALLTALGEYSSSLPNFQMIEIMMFILGKAPASLSDNQVDPQSVLDSELQHMLLKALLTVAEKFVPVQFSTTFPLTFLDPLLAKLHTTDPDARLLVLRIFQTLIDRKSNLDKLEQPSVEPRSDLVAQKPNFNKQDNTFFMKHGEKIYRELVSVLRSEPVSVEFLEQLHTTTALLLLECNSDENIRLQMDMIQEIQELAVKNNNSLRLSNANKFALHATCISQLAVLSFVVRLPDIFEYKDRLVSLRRSLVPHLLPPLETEYSPDIDPDHQLEQSLIDLEPVKAALKECGRYTDKAGVPGGSQSLRNSRANSPRHSPRNSWIESVHSVQRRPSSVSVSSITVDVDSCASSPGIMRRPPVVEVSFAEMKRALAEPSLKDRESEEKLRKQMQETFMTATFSELCSLTLANKPQESLYQCLTDIYGRTVSVYSVVGGEGGNSRKSSLSVDTTDIMSPVRPEVHKPMYEEYFPELFMY